MCIPCFFTVSTSEVGIVESWGKFSRLVQPGLACVLFRKWLTAVCNVAKLGLVYNDGILTCLRTLVCFLPAMEQLVGRLSFRVQQLDVRVETKTLDNVFLTAVVSVQYQVLRESVFEAFYSLTNPAQQIT